DIASLAKGVAAMRQLAQSNPSDPRGWVQQAFIHGNCDGFTRCQHGNWYFFPWHRAFLYHFEQLIQHFSGDDDFALPYWDWSRTHSVPASFFGATNPLDDLSSLAGCNEAPTAGRGRLATERLQPIDLAQYVGPDRINTFQQNRDFASYGGGASNVGALEGLP